MLHSIVAELSIIAQLPGHSQRTRPRAVPGRKVSSGFLACAPILELFVKYPAPHRSLACPRSRSPPRPPAYVQHPSNKERENH
eukprot:scaffold26257_cov100-Isochrysis_galbana.AAC.5